MSFLLNGFHPTFEALSGLVDQSDVDAARTRVGRHVAHCAACAETVAGIRAMGDGARAIELPGAPSGLWERIERAAAEQGGGAPARETPAPDADKWKAAPALRPTTHVPSPLRRATQRGALALAAAAVVVAVLLVPTSRGGLQAGAKTGRWRLSPQHPVPGQPVSVRYEPAPTMRGGESLVLLGSAWDTLEALPRFPYWRGILQDSLGVLVRGTDGGYVGRFVYPADKQVMALTLSEAPSGPHASVLSPAGPVDRAAIPVTFGVAGDVRGRPSLGALTLASRLWSGVSPGTYVVSDTLIKYFPAEPIGYASATPSTSHRLLDELIAYFKRGERQYLNFDRRFMAERTPSAEHEIAMVTFANRIDEPGEARKWALRFAAHHPDDPRALDLYAGTLRDALARSGTVDSVRRGLPLADSLWERNGHRLSDGEIASVAWTVGDRDGYRRWMKRAAFAGVRYYDGTYIGSEGMVLEDPSLDTLVRSRLRARIATECRLPAGKYPRWTGVRRWTEDCEASRQSAYEVLSSLERRGGRGAHALSLADSAITLAASSGRSCAGSSSHLARGEALLALGDTSRAIPELARGFPYASWQGDARRDSMAARLRSAIPVPAWRALVDSARANVTRCVAAARAAAPSRSP